MTNNTTSNDFQLYTSSIGTSGFTQYHISTRVGAATYSFTLDTEIVVELGVNNFFQLRGGSAFSPFRLQMNIQQIPSSYTVIQNTTQNNYINPATSQITWLSLRNTTAPVAAFINGGGTFPAYWRNCLTTGNFNGEFEGSISHVFAANTSTPSYIEISKTGRYKIHITYANYVTSAAGTINTFFNLIFYDITADTFVAFASTDFRSGFGPVMNVCTIHGVHTLQSGH